MSAKNEQTLRRLVSSIKQADRPKTSGYDTQATVRRIEDGVAWVHIPGGVDETPVKLTIAASPGDTVQVRVAGGRAFLVGNASAPPTDDTTAKAAVRQIGVVNKAVKAVRQIAERAAKIAGNTNQYFWHTESGTDTGAHITEIPQEDFLKDPENGGGNLLARSNGIAIRDGLEELATFSADGANIYGMEYNPDTETHERVEVTHLGFGTTQSEAGQNRGEYYTIGRRASGSIPGWRSISIGYYNTCDGNDSSISIGMGNRVNGYGVAIGESLGRAGRGVSIGRYNDESHDFVVGIGTGENNRIDGLWMDADEGNLHTYKNVVTGGEQFKLRSETPSAVSVSSGTWTTIINYAFYDEGTYLVVYGAGFTTNATGYRQLHLYGPTTSAGRWSPSVQAVSGEQTRINASDIVVTSEAGHSIELRVRQNSGSDLDVYGWIKVIKIG